MIDECTHGRKTSENSHIVVSESTQHRCALLMMKNGTVVLNQESTLQLRGCLGTKVPVTHS